VFSFFVNLVTWWKW